MSPDLTQLSAAQAAESIRDGRLTSEALVAAYLKRIEETDGQIKAWAWLDPAWAMAQAQEADRIRRAGRGTGPLHGVPVGLKDIIDTKVGPTQYGSQAFAGRNADRDARLVENLINAGAVIMGKTVTCELAFLKPADTTNPHSPAHTPGGSSAGSAAAVAARHVPLAVGSQTGGSVIRPASFCGTFGFKPTRGLISRSGVLSTVPNLDQMGVFANSLEDAALLADVIAGYDQDDPASQRRPRPAMLQGARSEAPVEPDIAWFDLPYHDKLNKDAHDGICAVFDVLGARVERFDAAPQLAGLTDVHKTIYDYELGQNVSELVTEKGDMLSDEIKAAVARGQDITAMQYEDAVAVKNSADAFFVEHFNDFDAILSPSAVGEALPLSAGSTGDASFCLIWTLAGLPCVTIPALVGEHGLPIGIQLIGAAEEDDRLLRTCAWVQKTLADAGADAEKQMEMES
jgi:Asp-tRNA(Asn)/Glu-tRNA(Gln) amidotransferase A subunit family amidase